MQNDLLAKQSVAFQYTGCKKRGTELNLSQWMACPILTSFIVNVIVHLKIVIVFDAISTKNAVETTELFWNKKFYRFSEISEHAAVHPEWRIHQNLLYLFEAQMLYLYLKWWKHTKALTYTHIFWRKWVMKCPKNVVVWDIMEKNSQLWGF